LLVRVGETGFGLVAGHHGQARRHADHPHFGRQCCASMVVAVCSAALDRVYDKIRIEIVQLLVQQVDHHGLLAGGRRRAGLAPAAGRPVGVHVGVQHADREIGRAVVNSEALLTTQRRRPARPRAGTSAHGRFVGQIGCSATARRPSALISDQLRASPAELR
jgi:hypothetical protein